MHYLVLFYDMTLRQRSRASSLPAGPANIDELHEWPSHVIDRCVKANMDLGWAYDASIQVTVSGQD